MQILITHGRLARTRALQFSALQAALAGAAVVFVLLMLSGAIYHFVFLTAAREGWPVVSSIVRLVVRDEIAQRERYMRDNLDAMAQKVGEMQAKMVKLEAVSDRVSGLAGLKAEDVKPQRRTAEGGRGGPYIPARRPSLEELQRQVSGLDEAADWQTDLFTFSESRLLQVKLDAMRVPSAPPVEGPVGSGFGFRADPFTGREALHTGLDFPAEPGTQIKASAGGVVLFADSHPEYGQMLELDHGNGLVTRYAHCQKLLVKRGQLIKRGQVIAEVGSSGRSTGPHLHFEVLVDGAPQDPARFLAGGASAPAAGGLARR
ncbi:MAG: M23 family metallopeptidase [Proteobacteria bacterium]|nr:M23 family metallopeptidase [Pseudomonadota bacterium]